MLPSAALPLGIVPTVRHADYIGSWLEVLREDNRAIVRAASHTSKAADYTPGLLAGGMILMLPAAPSAAVDRRSGVCQRLRKPDARP